jgi:serine/threonine-protein kinase RsbW
MLFPLHTTFASTNTVGEVPPDASWSQESIIGIASITPAVEKVAAAMDAAGYASRDIFAVRLALEEAVVNAIKHGHQGDASRPVRLRYLVDADEVLLAVEDQGPGFHPDDVPDPLDPENLERACGRGVFLMRHYMTWVKYNERGNCVTLCKRRG